MRTTIDIPDELLRRAKSTAALRGLKLKDLVAAFIEEGLRDSIPTTASRGQARKLPEFIKRSGSTIPSLDSHKIEAILLQEELVNSGSDRPS